MKTHLIILADRSGSMQSMQAEATGGIQGMIEEAREGEGECVASLIYFDSSEPHQIAIRLEDVEDIDTTRIRLSPRGSTPLYDAIAQAVAFGREVESFVDNTMLAVFTDGYENASRESSLDDVRDAIEDVEGDDWIVTFAAANLDAHEVGSSFGLTGDTTLTYTTTNSNAAYDFNTRVLREARSAGAKGTFRSAVEV